MPQYPPRISWSQKDDDEAWERMLAEQRARNAEQEAQRAEKYADTAALAGTVNSAADVAPTLMAGHDKGALLTAKTAKRYTGAVGNVLDGAEALAGYRGDRSRGMARDEALLKNGGGFAAGLGAARAGAWIGAKALAPWPPYGPAAGAAIGGLAGYFGQPAANWTTNRWRDMKVGAANTEAYWRSELGRVTSPTSLIKSLRRGP